jgi:Domain of unknown function (DUF4160)
VPRISSFYGIVVSMNYREHPPPHFHVQYGGHQATIELATLDVYRGQLPARALRLVREWARLHDDELAENWKRARSHLPLRTIDPLT